MSHPHVAPLAFLIGRWVGAGRGIYPTITAFDYREVVEITAMPGPALAYGQRTADARTGDPRHAERGYLRFADGSPELVICQPTGIVEVHGGTVEATRLDLTTTVVGTTASAAGHRVRAVRRVIEVRDDVLSYELHMAAVGQPMQLHLSAQLERE